MKLVAVLLPGILILSTGCYSVVEQIGGSYSEKHVELVQRDEWIEDARKEFLNEEATVKTRNGLLCDGTIIELTRDSLYMQQKTDGSSLSLQLDQIELIQRPRNVTIQKIGLAGGALTGALIGGAIVAASTPPDTLGGPSPRTDAFMIGMTVGLVVGGVLGLAIGGAATSVTDYQIANHQPRNALSRPDNALPDSAQTETRR